MGIPVHKENYGYYCYLYHSLYDHTDLGWINMLRIGMIWVDIKVRYQKFFEI